MLRSLKPLFPPNFEFACWKSEGRFYAGREYSNGGNKTDIIFDWRGHEFPNNLRKHWAEIELWQVQQLLPWKDLFRLGKPFVQFDIRLQETCLLQSDNCEVWQDNIQINEIYGLNMVCIWLLVLRIYILYIYKNVCSVTPRIAFE